MSMEDRIFEALEKLSKDVSEIREDVSGLKNEVSELKNEVGEIKEDLNGLKNEVSGLKNEVREIKIIQAEHTKNFEQIHDSLRNIAAAIHLTTDLYQGLEERVRDLEKAAGY